MKKISFLVLALVLVFNLAACGKSEKDVNVSSDEGEETAENVEQEEPVTFTIFIDHSWFWFDSWGNDPISQEITNQTGVDFEVIRATDEQQLALLIASGDLPDLIYTSNLQTMALLEDQDICYPYNELVESAGVDIHASETEISNNTADDGNYYVLRNASITQEAVDSNKTLASGGTNTIAYRTDIYEAIGSPEINTLEDLEQALEAAKELYPDVIPLLNNGTPATHWNLWYFAEQLGVRGAGSVGYNADEEACYMLNAEGIEDYLALLNRFARKGLISAEAQTYNYDRFAEVRNSGSSFMQLRAADEAISSNNAALEAGTDYTWKLISDELTDQVEYLYTSIGWSGTYISKNCSDPERAIAFLSWCRSEEGRKLTAWGIQGEHWDYNDAGETITTEAYQAEIAEGKQKQDDFGIGVWIFGDQGDENAFIDHGMTDPDQLDYIERLQNAVSNITVRPELYFAIPTSGEELTILNSLNDMVSSEILKVIFAETDEEYEAAVESLYKQAEQIGVEKLETWMREAVAERGN